MTAMGNQFNTQMIVMGNQFNAQMIVMDTVIILMCTNGVTKSVDCTVEHSGDNYSKRDRKTRVELRKFKVSACSPLFTIVLFTIHIIQ